MNTDRPVGAKGSERLAQGATTERIIGLFYNVYNELGGGFVESVYCHALAIALQEVGLSFEREPSVPIEYHEHVVGVGKPDFIIDGSVIVECKALRALEDWHRGQVIHYLRASRLQVALLLNFGPRPEAKRIILERNDNHRG